MSTGGCFSNIVPSDRFSRNAHALFTALSWEEVLFHGSTACVGVLFHSSSACVGLASCSGTAASTAVDGGNAWTREGNLPRLSMYC
ncbi:hypothetical protein MTO96_014366 [Rhipicephalus appendiculatus]